jgi:hypothetical protein
MFTVDILESKKACLSQVKLFKEHFPNGSPLTVESALSVASIFDWDWAAHRLLSAKGVMTYKEQAAPILNMYLDQTASLLKTYRSQIASLLKTSVDQVATLLETTVDQMDHIYKTYKYGIAPIFASIYISEQ